MKMQIRNHDNKLVAGNGANRKTQSKLSETVTHSQNFPINSIAVRKTICPWTAQTGAE